MKSIEGGMVKRIFSLAEDGQMPTHVRMLYAAFLLQLVIFIMIVIIIAVLFSNSFSDLINAIDEMALSR
jgi:hypothetical protein